MRKRISKYKHLHSNRFRYLSSSIPLICASGLLLVTGLMINPLGVSGQTFAASIGEATNPGGGDDTVDETSVELTVTQSTLTKPSMAGVVNYISTGLSVTAKKVDTYNIVVQATEDATGSLVGETTGAEIRGVGSNVATSAFTDDSWGYALAEGAVEATGLEGLAYSTVPENGQGATAPAYTQKTKDEAVSGKDFTLAFAAKFGNNTRADHYRSNVLVSVAVNPEEVVSLGFGGVETMQELTPALCRAVDITNGEVEGQLKDARDGKVYWVAKLKDGNCWMTQNLDYSPKDDMALDVSERNTFVKVTDTNGDNGGPAKDAWQIDAALLQYWDPGKKFLDDGKLTNALTSTDKHLLIGNYYSYAAATAGTAPSETGKAEASVCPAGWQLPTSSDAKGGSFSMLQSAGEIGNVGSLLNRAPYYFQYSGGVDSGNINQVGSTGYYWSSIANSNASAEILSFTTSNINTSTSAFRYIGRPIRCLAEVSTLKNIVDMNELTKEVCRDTDDGTTNTLKDTSVGNGGRSYRVTKLQKDHACWMTQNLNNETGRSYENATYGGYYVNTGSETGEGTLITGSNAAKVCKHLGGNWGLPTYAQYLALTNGMTKGSELLAAPYYFQYGGTDGNPGDASRGNYWSSTSNASDNHAYSLFFYSGEVRPSNGHWRYVAMNVRCIVPSE